MSSAAAIIERLEHDGVQDIECTVPPDMTLDEWRRRRPRKPRRSAKRLLTRAPRAERHLALVPDERCDHLHDTTSRYDRGKKLLTFLLVCPECGTEKVVETLRYEPHFEQQHERLAA